MPPRKRKSLAPDTPLTPAPSEILDQFMGQGPLSVEELDAAVRRFKKAIVERAPGGELTHHLGYPPGGAKPEDIGNRNGTSPKTVLTDDGSLTSSVPRDREGTFAPRLIPKHARRFAGFDDKILALCARGHDGARDPSLPRGDVRRRSLAGFDQYGHRRPGCRGHRVAAARAVLPNRTRDILGIWIEQTEGAKFWMKTRGHLPTDEAATKLIWLALRNITARWGAKAGNYWHLAMQQFAILFEDRFTPRVGEWTRAWTLPTPPTRIFVFTVKTRSTAPHTKFLTLPKKSVFFRVFPWLIF